MRGATVGLVLVLFLPLSGLPQRECLVEVRFDRLEGELRLKVGATLHQGWAQAVRSAAVRGALRELRLEYLRLPTGAELGPFAGPVPGLMDISNLAEAAKFALSVGAKPLVCIRTQPAWGLSPSEFGAYCGALAQALKREGLSRLSFEIFESPDMGPDQMTAEETARYFVKARKAIKALLPWAEVGGPGLSAPWREEVEDFVGRCGRLDFLSFHFFGTHNASTSSGRLFRAAWEAVAADLPDQLTPGEVRATLIAVGHTKAKVLITRLGVNSIRNPDGTPKDPRVSSGYSAAWLASFLASTSREVDSAIYYDALRPGWGLLRGEKKTPAYYALWLFSTYFPRGAKACFRSSSGPGFCFAARTKTAGNVLLVNISDFPVKFTVAAFGMGRLRMCRARIYRASKNSILYVPLPLRRIQRLILGPRDVAVVQFVPPR
ncbi:MAG TPA: hypothetical protein EYP65_07985 [Armatimonadetes bacterium]|nr:hypothetical protein [Armatimonadota bacterium]